MSEQQFDEIFERIKSEGVAYGSGPSSVEDAAINHNFAGRGIYFKDPNGHILEILTKDYVTD